MGHSKFVISQLTLTNTGKYPDSDVKGFEETKKLKLFRSISILVRNALPSNRIPRETRILWRQHVLEFLQLIKSIAKLEMKNSCGFHTLKFSLGFVF